MHCFTAGVHHESYDRKSMTPTMYIVNTEKVGLDLDYRRINLGITVKCPPGTKEMPHSKVKSSHSPLFCYQLDSRPSAPLPTSNCSANCKTTSVFQNEFQNRKECIEVYDKATAPQK